MFRYLSGAVYLQQSYWPIEWGFALHTVRTPAWFSAPLGVGGIPIFETHVIRAAAVRHLWHSSFCYAGWRSGMALILRPTETCDWRGVVRWHPQTKPQGYRLEMLRTPKSIYLPGSPEVSHKCTRVLSWALSLHSEIERLALLHLK